MNFFYFYIKLWGNSITSKYLLYHDICISRLKLDKQLLFIEGIVNILFIHSYKLNKKVKNNIDYLNLFQYNVHFLNNTITRIDFTVSNNISTRVS